MANDQVITIMRRTISFISLSLFNKKESNFILHTLFHYDNVAGFSNHWILFYFILLTRATSLLDHATSNSVIKVKQMCDI
jgi:hypothetical protein